MRYRDRVTGETLEVPSLEDLEESARQWLYCLDLPDAVVRQWIAMAKRLSKAFREERGLLAGAIRCTTQPRAHSGSDELRTR